MVSVESIQAVRLPASIWHSLSTFLVIYSDSEYAIIHCFNWFFSSMAFGSLVLSHWLTTIFCLLSGRASWNSGLHKACRWTTGPGGLVCVCQTSDCKFCLCQFWAYYARRGVANVTWSNAKLARIHEYPARHVGNRHRWRLAVALVTCCAAAGHYRRQSKCWNWCSILHTPCPSFSDFFRIVRSPNSCSQTSNLYLELICCASGRASWQIWKTCTQSDFIARAVVMLLCHGVFVIP